MREDDVIKDVTNTRLTIQSMISEKNNIWDNYFSFELSFVTESTVPSRYIDVTLA